MTVERKNQVRKPRRSGLNQGPQPLHERGPSGTMFGSIDPPPVVFESIPPRDLKCEAYETMRKAFQYLRETYFDPIDERSMRDEIIRQYQIDRGWIEG